MSTNNTASHTATPKPLLHQVRRWIVGVIIVSFGIAALGGIIVLISGSFNDTAGRVLGTTALVGLFSVAALCGVALLGKRAQWFGWVTVGIALITLGRLLWLIWAEPAWSDFSFETTLNLCIITAACSVASLLLLLSDHRRKLVRGILIATLVCIGVGTMLTVISIWGVVDTDYETYWRVTGVVWILGALGVVVLPVMSLLLRKQEPIGASAEAAQVPVLSQTDPGSANPGAANLVPAQSLSPESLGRIEAAARASQLTPDEFVQQWLPK
ncbi:MAG: hypothetical protein GX814_09510 [Microbacteriaceae bacterium]|nr:hypothetical protein [Microbacteriaceae bacterium]